MEVIYLGSLPLTLIYCINIIEGEMETSTIQQVGWAREYNFEGRVSYFLFYCNNEIQLYNKNTLEIELHYIDAYHS